MVEGVNIYFEGDKRLRPGFHRLLAPQINRWRQQHAKFKLIPGGSRGETIKDFLRSCKSQPSDLNVLLIDAEGPVPNATAFVARLRSERYWDSEANCEDDQVNFMVQTMEAWFVADQQALVSHFGSRFNANALPSPQNAESIAPSALVDAIQHGLISLTHRGRNRRRYDKVADGVKLLGLIDHSTVGRHCPHFKRLIDFLDQQF